MKIRTGHPIPLLLSLMLSMLLFAPALLYAGSPYDDLRAEYPRDRYMVGIGEVEGTNNFFKDRRVAEVLARLEIAKQIKVRLREETLDIMCEGGKSGIFKNVIDCRNTFLMVVEVTVDQFLTGSMIVSKGERNGIVYAVAVLPKKETGEALERGVQDSVDKTREGIKEAKEGRKEGIRKAQEEYAKAVTLDKEKEIIEGVKSRASEAFNDLEDEIMRAVTGWEE